MSASGVDIAVNVVVVDLSNQTLKVGQNYWDIVVFDGGKIGWVIAEILLLLLFFSIAGIVVGHAIIVVVIVVVEPRKLPLKFGREIKTSTT